MLNAFIDLRELMDIDIVDQVRLARILLLSFALSKVTPASRESILTAHMLSTAFLGAA